MHPVAFPILAHNRARLNRAVLTCCGVAPTSGTIETPPPLSFFFLPPLESFTLFSDTDKDEVIGMRFNTSNTLSFPSLNRARLFDAVASLLNITDYNSYEGEAPILLENYIDSYNLTTCKSYLNSTENGISAKEIVQNMYIDIKNGVSKENCIVNFLFTLADKIIKIAKKRDYKYIALSGGVFQNSTLVDMLIELAPKEIKLYFHKDLSPNDENISFGQLMYYLNIKSEL